MTADRAARVAAGTQPVASMVAVWTVQAMSSSARPDESPSTVQRTEEVVEVTAGDFYFVAFLVLTALVVLALTALSF